MGPWLQIILSIVEAFPAVLKIIQEVIALMAGHPAQLSHEHAFSSLLLDWEQRKDKSALVTGLQCLRDDLKCQD